VQQDGGDMPGDQDHQCVGKNRMLVSQQRIQAGVDGDQ